MASFRGLELATSRLSGVQAYHIALQAEPGSLRRTSGDRLAPFNYEWWAWVDLNYRPHAYQACALTT